VTFVGRDEAPSMPRIPWVHAWEEYVAAGRRANNLFKVDEM
jgi:hypothetical protein